MQTSSRFFESFYKAGFLKLASWTPSPAIGGGPYEAQVRYRAPASTVMSDGLRVVDHEIQYVTEQLPGLAEGEQLTIDGVAYRVRERPEAMYDGSVSRAELSRVIP